MSKILCKYLDENGHDYEPISARKAGLIKNQFYEFAGIDIGGCSSEVYLKDFKDRGFNSVMFEYFINGEEIDIIDYILER